MAVRGLLAIAGVVLLLACGADGDDGAGAAGAQGSPLHGAGSGDRAGAGRSADAGRSSTGASGRDGSSGSSGVAGAGPRAGSGPAAGGQSGAAGGNDGAAGASAVDNRCTTDADCVLCTAALPPGCCSSCPTVRSKAQCDADQRAFKQRCASNTSLIPAPVCPAILCVDPGQAQCQNGMCMRVGAADS